MFSYVSIEEHIPPEHPLQRVKANADVVLVSMKVRFETKQPFVVKRCFAWLGLALGGEPGTRMAFEHYLS